MLQAISLLASFSLPKLSFFFDLFFIQFIYSTLKTIKNLLRRKSEDNILFETDNRQDAWDFLSIYITYKDANRDNWEMYRDSEKYNIV